MSLRSRGGAIGGRSRQGVRPVYEDFKPMSEWKHEEGAAILLYHLPGFVKEQIRILAESKGLLRIFGERFVGGNKWSRFQEEVVAPEDSNMTDIRARFEGGVLKIIMPKKTITPPATQPTQTQDQSSLPSSHESPKTTTPKPELETKQQQTLQEKASKSDLKQAQEEAFDVKNEAKEGEEHHREEEVEKGTRDRRNEVPNDANEKMGSLEEKKGSEHRFEESKRVSRSSIPRSLGEDRQLLVNMGVAVLVIVGLGAYVSYSFGSST